VKANALKVCFLYVKAKIVLKVITFFGYITYIELHNSFLLWYFILFSLK